MQGPEAHKPGERVPLDAGTMPTIFHFKPTQFEYIELSEWERLMAEGVGIPVKGGEMASATGTITGSQSGFDDIDSD